MTAEEITTLFAQEGLYVLADGRCPGATSAVMVLTDDTTAARRAFMLVPGCELSPDPAAWHNHAQTSLAGGPFSTQACRLIEKEGQRLHDLEAAVAEAKELLRMYRDALLGRQLHDVAMAMQTILDTLSPNHE